MRNAGLEEVQAGIKIARRNINHLRYADDTTLMAESEEELKGLLTKVKEENEKAGLKAQHSKTKDHGIRSHHFLANRWGNNEDSDRPFFFGGGSDSKITADGDCSHEIKTLAPCKESYDQPRQHIKEQRYYFANKGPSSQGYGFSSGHVWM